MSIALGKVPILPVKRLTGLLAKLQPPHQTGAGYQKTAPLALEFHVIGTDNDYLLKTNPEFTINVHSQDRRVSVRLATFVQ